MRQLVLQSGPGGDGRIVLTGGDYRYLAQVLRLKEGASVDARLPDGSLARCRVDSLDARARRVALVVEVSPRAISREKGMPGRNVSPPSSLPESFPRIVLFQWLLKGPKMDTVVRQATEMGVVSIVPVMGERCVASEGSPGRLERWERVIREARQQSGSPLATGIGPITKSSEVPEFWARQRAAGRPLAFVMTEAPLALKTLHGYLELGADTVAVAVGPEGGMSASEIDMLVAAGFMPVHFATNVLRAETCALYAVAAVQNALLEYESWHRNA
jgi:16S rRNA (uracil1498-N3)-methyltransferase